MQFNYQKLFHKLSNKIFNLLRKYFILMNENFLNLTSIFIEMGRGFLSTSKSCLFILSIVDRMYVGCISYGQWHHLFGIFRTQFRLHIGYNCVNNDELNFGGGTEISLIDTQL